MNLKHVQLGSLTSLDKIKPEYLQIHVFLKLAARILILPNNYYPISFSCTLYISKTSTHIHTLTLECAPSTKVFNTIVDANPLRKFTYIMTQSSLVS